MSDPAESTSRSISLRSSRSLIVSGNSLISRGLQDLAKLTATPSLMPSALTGDIHEAARKGDNASVRQILKNDLAKIDARDSDRRTPLHLAAEYDHADVAEVLLSHGADDNAEDKRGLTPGKLAARFRHRDVLVELVVKAVEDRFGYSSLHRAAGNGRADVAEVLLSHGADVDARDKWCDTFRHWTAESRHADVWDRTPLHWAVESGHADVAEILLSQGADVDARDSYGETPLHVADQPDVAELLLSYGADVNARNNDGETPLDHAGDNDTSIQ